jgi:Tfp pilus assembly protein PilO
MKSILLSLVVLPILGCPMSAVTTQNSAESNKCPDQPIQSLQASNVKSITLPAKLSDTASQEIQLGYTFEAKSGQKINLRNIDDLCIWIYSPDNQLLNGADLPKTGKYTVQIASKKDSQKLDIDVGFNDVNLATTSPSATKQNLTNTDNNQKTQETELQQEIEARTGELVNLFVGNLPVSVIIDDIRKRTPITVQVETITQSSVAPTAQSAALSTISLNGKATSYNELNDFLMLLRASPVLKGENTQLVSSSIQPATSEKNFTLINFQIRAVVASPTEILPYLQKIGADGLATRINLLKQQGVISEGQVVNKSNIAQKIEEVNRTNIYVLSLLPNVDNIDTLIRDIQEQIPKTIVFAVPPDFSYELAGTLRTFQPTAPVIGSQYSTYAFTVGFDGKFEDVLNTIQKIERLKPLLIVKDLKLTKKALPTTNLKFSRPLAAGKKKDILDNLPPLMGADFTIQVFVPKTLGSIGVSGR